MKFVACARSIFRYGAMSAALVSTMVNLVVPPVAAASNPHEPRTLTPIKHVIVIIGENRTFDHVYATYKPRF
jgi:phospholipase C